MRRRRMLQTAAIVLAATSMPEARAGETPAVASLDPFLQPLLAQYGLPALAAAVVQGGAVIAAGAVGTRRAGTEIPVAIDDRFHIGSDAKAMTSLLAGMTIEQGRLRWDSTVAEVFPEFAATMDEGLRRVTLTQLLSHTSGIPGDNEAFDRLIFETYRREKENLDQTRLWMVGQWSRHALASPPGTRFAYSNMGYVVAGAMLERVGGATWEEMAATRIFDPLGLRTAGFGPQSSMGRVDAPLGHVIRDDGSLFPILAGPAGDNPLVLGPAGTMHLSILDFARWAAWNAGEGRRGPALVRPETLRRLHTKVIEMAPRPDAAPGTPSAGGYALGWGVATLPFATGPLLAHNGSNVMNLATIVLQPQHDFGLVAATNVGGRKADAALKDLTEALFKRFSAAG